MMIINTFDLNDKFIIILLNRRVIMNFLRELQQNFVDSTQFAKKMIYYLYRKICTLTLGQKVFVVGTITVGGVMTYLYFRRNGKDDEPNTPVQGVASKEQLTKQQMQMPPQVQFKLKTKWQILRVRKQDFDALLTYASVQKFQKDIDDLLCPFTQRIMIIPCQMICCIDNKEIVRRWAEKEVLQEQVILNQKCKLCNSSALLSFIQIDMKKYNQIQGTRSMVLKTFTNIKQDQQMQKLYWTTIIKKYFGKDYIKNDLGTVI